MSKSSVCVLLLGLTCFARGADSDDKKTPPATPEKANSPEDKAVLSLTTALRWELGKTTDSEARKVLVAAYSEKLLAHTRKHLHDPSGLKFILEILRFNWDEPRSKSRLEALALLKKEYSRSKLIQEHLREIARQSFPWEKEGCLDVVEAVYQNNPDKLTRALAARVLVNHMENRVKVAQLIQKDEKGRAGAEKAFGKDVIQGFLDRVDANKKAAQKYRLALKTDLKGVLADLSIGEPAPETISEDLEGKKVKLSDCMGKVVVLDFWGTWCPPCKAMIPHARELVKKMEGKPFVFISVSVGDDKATLAAFLKKTEMPWSQWWDGHDGKARQLWNVESYPTIFVIDHKGIIRHRQEDYDPKKDDLERIVKKLVTAAEPPKAPAPLRQSHQAVQRGLEFLQKDAAKWRKERQCSTCHHGTMTVWALCEAKSQGYAVAASTLADTAKWTRDRLLDRIDQPRDKRVGWNMVSTPAIYLSVMASCVPKQDAVSAGTLKRIAGHLVRHQESDGSWAWSLAPAQNRPPPVFESDEVATLLGCAALQPLMPADAKVKSEIRDARKKAEAWLAKTKPSDTTQALACRLLVKALAAAPAKVPQREIDQLLARQNKDGGWGQLVGAASDAYATGQTLYVLSLAGLASDRAEVRRGVLFLVNTQKADGSWPMTTRAHHGATPAKNQVPIVYFGSAWATLGLMRSVAR